MLKKIVVYFFCFSITPIFAYTPTSSVLDNAKNISQKINSYIASQDTTHKASILKLLSDKLPALQAHQFFVKNIERMYLFEYVRRHLIGSEMIDTSDLIDDDNLGVTWTHAPKNFGIIYSPYSTPPLSALDAEKNFSTLIN